MKLFVSGLKYTLTADEVRELFERFGEVAEVTVPLDSYEECNRGFVFINMRNDTDGTRAIDELNGKPFHGRYLKVEKGWERDSRW